MVTQKPDRAKESPRVAFELDMTYEDALSNIAIPFHSGQAFYCGGTVVQPSKVSEIKFNSTEQSADELLPLLRARARARENPFSVFLKRESVVHEGKDVTREVLNEAAKGAVTPAPTVSQAGQSDRVFIVHGRDDAAVNQTELLVRRFGLTPIILRDEPNAGRTVIEKFEHHSNVRFAIVLLTPDDVGGLKEGPQSPRARQNVVWEWGYLVARLGRPNVICLYKGNVEVPSDLNGLVTIHIDDDARNSYESIRREFVAAGFNIS